ncbi:MAG: polysaccharide ABC transporter ATP-binding protein [Pyrinomonadaceae bacterium]
MEDLTLQHESAIEVHELGKKYRLGERRAGYSTLRDIIGERFARKNVRSPSASINNGTRSPDFWALRDVSFSVEPGEVVGVIGRNGAGKSTLLKILSRITEPSAGSVDIYGRVGSLLEVGTGFHNELTGKENIYLSGAILGMKKAEIKRQFDEIVVFAEVENFLDTPVKHYSSGMTMRLAFAVSAHLQPEILLIDEVLAVGDAAFQSKCLGKMGDVARQGRTILFVSHNMSAILELCDRSVLIEKGQLAYDGPAAQCVEEYFNHNSQNLEETHIHEDVPLRINSIAINNGISTTVNAADGFDVSVSLSGQDINNPAIYFIIENVTGQTVVHKRIKSRELGLEQIDGHYKLNLGLPPLWLSPGVYSLYFKFIAPATGWSGTLRSERVMLEIRGALEGTGKSLLNPEVEWNLECTMMGSAPVGSQNVVVSSLI